MSTHKVGTFESVIKDIGKTVDFTIDGKCSGCGSCCGNYLPLSEQEIREISAYVEKNHIKACNHFIAPVIKKPEFDISCPFLDLSKEKDKCTIYKHRPYICRTYNCHTSAEKSKHDKVMLRRNRLVVDMRATFFGGRTQKGGE